MFDINERPEWAHKRGQRGPGQHGEPGGPRGFARRRGGGPFGMDFGPPFGPGGPGGGRGRGGRGPGGPFAGPWGPDDERRRHHGHGRGRRSRGDVRLAILALLREESRHGYQIIQEIAERSGGSWKPSPGSVYPTVSQLADEGLVQTEKSEGRTVVHLTDTGRTYVEEHAAELDAVWSQVEAGAQDGFGDLRTAGRGLAGAVAQVAQVGSPEQVTEATKVLDEARRRLYLLLAEVDGSTEDSPEDEPTDEPS
ncbi:PadR family transcriptional regulator [Actinomycetospora termitidis]|uniref:PadR family transcriptional regulator n=1 Tax=Actinomycetospora termitidis TaxID=3053470 RepID=A0ABT7M7A6_9PSEU|nr:PadR family transcriptional regulator [Actinomycetospora sp. Odt1-22]MDL5156438.1 PadR family transcriptional regulator [Actinomycetospora sp. Odt1-22]